MSTNSALVLVAHADDETLGAGGLINKLVKNHWNVDVIIVSNGKLTVRGKIEDNAKDAYSACKVLGCNPPIFLDFPDQYFDKFAIADIANSVNKLKLEPTLIITHIDTDLNKDHRIVCEVAKIIGRPKTRSISILGCEIPTTSKWYGKDFNANYYVDITENIETKIKAFECYKNEVQSYPGPWSSYGLKILSEFRGFESGLKNAEAYHLIRGTDTQLP